MLLQQFVNPANPQVHHDTTGPEIWIDTDGNVDVFVSGVGTGGTLTGVSRYIKNTLEKPLHTVAVEPINSPVISQTKVVKRSTGPHKIQGIGAGFVPGNLDLAMVDSVEQAGDDEAVEMARRLAKEEGSWRASAAGPHRGSPGAWQGSSQCRQDDRRGSPDSGERYLSSVLFADLQRGGLPVA